MRRHASKITAYMVAMFIYADSMKQRVSRYCRHYYAACHQHRHAHYCHDARRMATPLLPPPPLSLFYVMPCC